jgi:hypothetical protein
MINPLAKPDCFTAGEWAKWLANLPAVTYRPNEHDWACQDCHPAHQRAMLLQGRCNWPDVEFFVMGDGTMEGRRTSITTPRGYDEGRKIIRLRKV